MRRSNFVYPKEKSMALPPLDLRETRRSTALLAGKIMNPNCIPIAK